MDSVKFGDVHRHGPIDRRLSGVGTQHDLRESVSYGLTLKKETENRIPLRIALLR
jgi:hypothetical protein